MSLNVKQAIIAILSVAIIIVLGYVIYSEREHALTEHKIIVKPDSAGCVRCHGYEDEQGGSGNDPGIVKHWEASQRQQADY